MYFGGLPVNAPVYRNLIRSTPFSERERTVESLVGRSAQVCKVKEGVSRRLPAHGAIHNPMAFPLALDMN
jgi:hypothetical protein